MVEHLESNIYHNFAHKELPQLVFNNPSKFYNDIHNKDYIVHTLWNSLAAKQVRKKNDFHISIENGKLNNQHEFCVITLPTPSKSNEPYFIAITFRVRRKIFRKEILELHYFTLELKENLLEAKENYFVREWLSPYPEPEQAYYGGIALNTIDYFLETLETILTGSRERYLTKPVFVDQFVTAPSCGALVRDEDGKYTIVSRPGVNLMHAMGHLFLRQQYDDVDKVLPEYKEKYLKNILDIEAWAEIQDSQWSDQQEERLAKQFEAYCALRKPVLKSLTMEDQTSPELIEIFDEWYGKDRE